MYFKPRNKYNNKKFENSEGKWDSQLEYHRWLFLKKLQTEGKIWGLARQTPFELIPKQTTLVDVQLKTKVKKVERVVEQNVEYKADFTYCIESNTGMRLIVEDTKSSETRKLPEYIIKRKLMRFNGNPIREILHATEPIPSLSTDIILTEQQ